MDRDVRRSTASLILLRLTVLLFLAGGTIGFYTPPWIDASLVPLIQTSCGLIGSATLMITLWVQGWYVAYVTADPPVATTSRGGTWIAAMFNWMFGLIFGLFLRRKTATEPKRRKKAEEGGPTKRKRKTKRKPRTRKVVEEEAESEEEEAAEEDSGESEEEASDEEEYQEEEAEEEETAPARVTAPMAKTNPPSHNNYRVDQRTNQPPPPKSNSSWASQQQDEEEESDDDGESWQADGPSPDQLKGLSKRQRRALIKQHRDQQRANRDR
jgi:hypothetical protein